MADKHPTTELASRDPISVYSLPVITLPSSLCTATLARDRQWCDHNDSNDSIMLELYHRVVWLINTVLIL